MLIGGCRIGSDKVIKPPAVQLTEKKFEKEESEPAKKPVEKKDSPKAAKIETTVSVKKTLPPKIEKKLLVRRKYQLNI